MADIASWWLKIQRAEKHLAEFKAVAGEYIASNPYTVTKALEGNGEGAGWVHRVHITQPDPETNLAVILGDFLFNLRSALDHIAVATQPRKRRYSAYFPIVVDNIWERDAQGVYLKQHADARTAWYTAVQGMSDDVLTVVKGAQPYNGGGDPFKIGSKNQVLAVLGRLQNADKHRELIVVGGRLEHVEKARAVYADGRIHPLEHGGPPRKPGQYRVIDDGAEIRLEGTGLDPAEVKVELDGTVVVLVDRVGDDKRRMYKTPDTLEGMFGYVYNRILEIDALL